MRRQAVRLRGQVTIEYFILFATAAILTIIGFKSLNDNTNVMKTSLQGFVNAAAAKIAD